MAKATWNGITLAESNETIQVEGNHYFPPDSIKADHFKPSDLHTTCPWKGVASYYHLEASGETSENAAWFYPEPKEAASNIKDYVAFYGNKVQISA